VIEGVFSPGQCCTWRVSKTKQSIARCRYFIQRNLNQHAAQAASCGLHAPSTCLRAWYQPNV
jgi:hypothetical protein